MPKERFYHPAVVEGHEQEALDEGRAFEVAWGRDDLHYDGPSVRDPGVIVAGIPMDESAVTRLIATLKRARRQAWPHRAPCADGAYCHGPHCPPVDAPTTP